MYRKQNKTRRRGTVAVLCAVSLTAIVGVAALAVDGGLLLDKRRRVQAGADAAAMAAATNLFKHYTTYNGVDYYGWAKYSALAAAATNGYDSENSTITVNIPPQSGDHVGKKGYAEVIIDYKQVSYFSVIFGSADVVVRGRAVARGTWEPFNNGIIVLDPHISGALNAHGEGDVIVNNANVIVNSDSDTAGWGSGNAKIIAPKTAVTGGVNDYGHFVGKVQIGATPTPDPLRNLPAPDPNQMVLRSKSPIHKSNGDHTLYPGVYEGGISISGQATLTLIPGIYFIDNGVFEIKGQANLIAEGVMIYHAPKKSSSQIYIAGTGNVTISPPSSGLYKGISFFQDRDADVAGSIQGGGGFDITGTYYAASSLVGIAGNGDAHIGSQYISRMLDIGGNGNTNITWNADITAPIRKLGLVE